MISGSVDGIINLFDVTQTTEKDALQLSLNTDSSIVSFCKNVSLFILIYKIDMFYNEVKNTNNMQIKNIQTVLHSIN